MAELEPAAEALRQIGHPMLAHVEALIEQARGGQNQKSQGEAAG